IDQRVTDLAQRRRRRERVVDKGAAPALQGDLAADDHLPAVRPLEDGLDRGHVLARPHQVGTRTAAYEKVDRLHDDGSASAGLAREDVQPGLELDFEVVDDREVADREKAEHEWCGPPGNPMVSNL